MPSARPTRGRRQRQCDPASESRTLAAGWQTRAGERSIAPERPCGLELTACGCAASLGMVAGQLRPAARRKDTDKASLASGQNQLSRTIADRDASCARAGKVGSAVRGVALGGRHGGRVGRLAHGVDGALVRRHSLRADGHSCLPGAADGPKMLAPDRSNAERIFLVDITCRCTPLRLTILCEP